MGEKTVRRFPRDRVPAVGFSPEKRAWCDDLEDKIPMAVWKIRDACPRVNVM